MARYNGPIVDGDIHHGWKSQQEIIDYLPSRWQEYAQGRVKGATSAAAVGEDVAVRASGPSDVRGLTVPLYPRSGVINFNVAHGAMMRTSYPPDGSAPGSDYETLREQLLDKYDYYRGVLTFNVGAHANVDNQHFALALTRAIHDWNAEAWLSRDKRLYGVVAPSLANPTEGAKEIRRVAKSDRIVATLLAGSPLGVPYGDPIYDPIYKATVEAGLSLDIHPGGTSQEQPASGKPMTSVMAPPLTSREAMHHLASFVVHGTFEKFPDLRVYVKEHGLGWLPHLLWRLDANYELLKLESPWVKRLPSEYIREHVRIGTQPLDDCADPKDLQRVLQAVDGVEDMLIFSSDYPHVSYNDPGFTARRLPASWSRKVFLENACELYGWTPPPAEAERSARARVAAPV
jgi:predicted TIM-barrel fold metal-dependent hydrolase